MTMWIVASFLLALIIAWIALKPLLVADQFETVGKLDSSSIREDAKERALRSLKDLEFDFKMGKLSEEDYGVTKERLSIDLARVMDAEK